MNRTLNSCRNPAAHRQQLPPGRRHPATGYKMSVSAWAFARRPRFPAVQNARFSYGSCTRTLERGLAPECSQPGGHSPWIFACSSFGRPPLPPSRQNPNSCTPPMMRKRVREQRGPVRPRTGAAPCGRSFPARSWFTLFGGAGEHADRRDHGEVNGLARTLRTRPGPAPHRQQLAPRCRHPAAAYKNVRFTLELCTSDPFSRCTKMPASATEDAHPHRNVPASPGVHNSHPVGGRFPPIQDCSKAETAWKWARVQKCTQVPFPVHPNDIAGDGVGVGT